MCGGDIVSAYVPDYGVKERLKEHREMPVWKLRWVQALSGAVKNSAVKLDLLFGNREREKKKNLSFSK